MTDPAKKVSIQPAGQIRFEALRRCMKSPVFWLLLFTLLHGLWYAAIVHPWQAPDEYVHYEYLRGFLDQRTLDPFKDGRDGAVQQELVESLLAFQHYRYRLAPTLPDDVFRSNPTPLGGMHIYPHPPLYYLFSAPIYTVSQNASPLTQLYLLRTFSVLLQCATVWLTYQLAHLIFSRSADRWLPIFAAAVVAILPQYTYVSASYNNDSLVPAFIAASIYFLVRGYKQGARFRWYLLAALFGLLAMFTKRTAVGIVPILGIALLAYAIRWIQSGSRNARAGGIIIFAGLALALVTLVSFFLTPPTITGNLARLLRINPDSLLRLSTALQGTTALAGVDWPWFFRFLLRSFWGWFGWLTLPVTDGWVSFWGVVTLLLGLGTAVGLLRWRREPEGTRPTLLPFAVILLLGGWIGSLTALLALYLTAPATYPPQGRYLFPLLSLLAIIGIWSWKSLFPSWMQRGALIASWIGLAIYDLYVWGYVIIPAWYS